MDKQINRKALADMVKALYDFLENEPEDEEIEELYDQNAEDVIELYEECHNMLQAIDNVDSVAELAEMPSSINDEAIYRKVWKEHVIEDIEGRLEERDITLNEGTIDTIATRYVYEGDYDCNLCYWDNLDNLIDEYAREEDYTI